MRREARFIFVAAALGAAAGGSCQRSPQYKQDQEYLRPEQQLSYYANRQGKTPTQRIETMGQPKKRVFMLDFWNDTPVQNREIGTFAADELRRGLFLTQRMILPTEIKTELATSDFVNTGGDRIKVSQLIREGRRLGVAVVGIGRIAKIVFRQRGDEIGLLRQKQSLAGVDIELKLFDVAAGREMMAVSRSGEASANSNVVFESQDLESPEYRGELTKLALRNAIAGLVPDVVRSIEKMSWEGRVARVVGSKVYVNAGRTSGLVAGDILKVISPGDDIYDPASGAFLGRTKGQLKGTIEVADFIGPDGAVAEVHTGGNFQEGDSVQLY
ncbi:MAG TPA: hypothetical protein VM598_00200 [Bdellovibrionota bacterium]|nr:hypothetical protein [Bdellovibrionota bacterium]